jgi:hypothetical protein
VETYEGPVAFGLSREADEASLTVYLQKLSDDRVMEALRGKLSNEEIQDTVEWLTVLMRRHLSDEEYHRLFLLDED